MNFKNNSSELHEGQEILLGIRPEDIQLSDDFSEKCVIYSTLPSGMETIVKVKFKETMLSVVVFGRVDFPIDSTTGLDFDASGYHIFHKETGEKLASGGLKVL